MTGPDARTAPLRCTTTVLAEVLLDRRVVVVDVDRRFRQGGREVAGDRIVHGLPHQTPVLGGEAQTPAHRLEVLLAGPALDVEVRQAPLQRDPCAMAAVLLACDVVVALGRLQADVARARVDHHPHHATGIDLQFDEVVAASQRAELALGPGHLLAQDRDVGDVVEQVGAARLAAVVPVEALRHGPLDVAEDSVAQRRQLLGGDTGLPRAHPASDVEADGVRDDLPLGGEDSADRHAEADVGVGHERDVADRER